ncbi:MAG: FAD-binding and (Fe-S)-binding domain-containing protein [Desulfovibrionaceae bacterium]
MLHKGPHFSIAVEHLVPRVLGLDLKTFALWPEGVRDLTLALAEELFLVRYNPFISPDMVRASAWEKFNRVKPSLADEYATILGESMSRFWEAFDLDRAFRRELIRRFGEFMPQENIDTRPSSRVECATDATDLRMEMPLLVVHPQSIEEIQGIVRLANELHFALVPRGGGSGLTGGAVPADQRSVILSLSKLKKILSIDTDTRVLCAQAGVITMEAIRAAAAKGLLFTVDPASKTASSLGGNVSENSGGPFAFEYGTTIDCILSYRMVTPTGEVIEVRRANHPGHKILAEETAVFEVRNGQGELLETVALPGDQIRAPGLGKDVTNKFLGGLPGVQKEGVDGVIVDVCFICHPQPAHSRTLCLEFYGRSLLHAMYVIKDIVALRNTIRSQGDLVKISALEEFGIKYVQAINYQSKSTTYEGDPNSVLLIQLDSDDETALEAAVRDIVNICQPYDSVDVFAARDDREAELFWEDRHKLSAIAKRTSGFKINEDIVIPIDVIPEFASFLEHLNLIYMAKAYRSGLQDVGRLPGMGLHDTFINMEFNHTSRILMHEVPPSEVSDEELKMQAFYFFKDLTFRYPDLKPQIDAIHDRTMARRIIVANHMHAGDGNCHVNIPVNSNDPEMLKLAEEAAAEVMTKAQELKGVVSGEHGIGITKISFLSAEKMAAIKAYKAKVDPRGVLNPGKLTRPDLPVKPYTFSFNRLIEDIRATGLPDKEQLINLLTNVQVCTRCGKCKQVCPMYQPERSLMSHPRNKNISLGALIEAIYYTKVHKGEPDDSLLKQLRLMVEHCTGCGKCTAVCPVKIDSSGAALGMRALLVHEGMDGHPIKTRVLNYLAELPGKRVPLAARAAAVGQVVQNAALGLVPAKWTDRLKSPLFSGPGPTVGFRNLDDALALDKGNIFTPAGVDPAAPGVEAAFYFPGCGAGLFYRSIGLATIMLLLDAGVPVVLPPEHLCCGYPLLASGCDEAFAANRDRNIKAIREFLGRAQSAGLAISRVLTACGSCRSGLARYELATVLAQKTEHRDVTQFLMERQTAPVAVADDRLLYHAACHAEWSGLAANKAADAYAGALRTLTGATVTVSPGCCGESGLGALTSPDIYNKLRDRKKEHLAEDLADYPNDTPILVGCPSCKIGIARSLMGMGKPQPVLHTLEFLAQARFGADWEKRLRTALAKAEAHGKVRTVAL